MTVYSTRPVLATLLLTPEERQERRTADGDQAERCGDSATRSSGQTSASVRSLASAIQDKNTLQIADLILKWIDESVGKAKDANK